MSTIPRDVLSYTIAPYIPLEDLVLEKDKDQALEREYERRIEQLLTTGKDYQILAGGLESQDPRLLHRILDKVESYDDLEERIKTILLHSIDDEKLDVLNLLRKYMIRNVSQYVPLYIFAWGYYDNFIREVDVRGFDRQTIDKVFEEYLADKTYYLDKAIADFIDEIIRDIFEIHIDDIVHILSLPKHQHNLPLDFIRGYGYYLPLKIKVDVLRTLKQQGSEEYQTYRQEVLKEVDKFNSIVAENKQIAKDMYDLLAVIHDF